MLPEKFIAQMKNILGGELDEYVGSLGAPPVRAIRINTKKTNADAVLSVLPYHSEPIPYARGGYFISSNEDDKIGSHPLHHAGAFYVQEPSAMAPACMAPIDQDFLALDMCASPGGKSSQIAERLTRGTLVSNEIMRDRAVTLLGNVERQGFSNVIVTNTDTKTLAEWFDDVFDLVLCDAPCSGEGMFRKNPDAIAEWSPENVAMCAARQKEILFSAAKTVKRGGYLVYSTCTFSKEENEDVVSDFLARNEDFSLCDAPDEIKKATADGIGMPEARRFYPHVSRGEGQFMALMKKTVGGEARIAYRDGARALTKEEDKAAREFFASCFDEMPRGRLVAVGKNIFLSPYFPIPPHSVFSAGIKVGEVEKGRLVPHHQLFSALGATMKRKITLASDSPDAKKYIGGETIPTSIENGWAAVTIDGCAVGGAKVTDGVAKNHYPKGLRRKI